MKKCEMNWDLEAIYPSTELWDADFAKLEDAARKFAGFRGRLAESPAVFRPYAPQETLLL